MHFQNADLLIKQVEESIHKTKPFQNKDQLLVGVDLGTAYIVLVVLDKQKNPIACEMEFAQVLKDGLVVDYMGACQIVKKLKERLEERIGVELTKAAIAVPPGTTENDCKTHKYVVEGSGMEVTAVLDEPTAANAVLEIENGVIVDIGGGTTGLSILKDKEVIYTADEATGGTHLSLVISGNYKIPFEEAEELKKDITKQKEIFTIVRPVIQKMATIVKKHIQSFEVDNIYLVGGTCCLEGIEEVFEKEIGISTHKPYNPFLVTPLGIAMNCTS
ncbi:ethanolamine utilization protein EutJ [Inediibacterium massiliense]|uniref:ethanolamine utilization protein EutJ n=1 Tax=Inediibacterium massiliense TaxID=1658111 RepID=UPI0006B4C947|nr:ethanolamine utilization protein EutJ [Inediibacterium massiliense]